MAKNSKELQRVRALPVSKLSELYWNQKLSHTQIADMFKVSPTAIRNLFKCHKIKSRTNGESKKRNNVYANSNV